MEGRIKKTCHRPNFRVKGKFKGILKNSASLLSLLEKLDVRSAKSVQTFDFSTLWMGALYTHILKSMAGEDILVTQSIQVGAKHIVKTKCAKW